jgi:hypothetical protein
VCGTGKTVNIAGATMKMSTFLGLLGVLLLASPVNADMTLKLYKQSKAVGGEKWTDIQLYFLGAGNAYQWANVQLFKNQQAMLFCQPQELTLNAQNIMSILEAELALMSKSDMYKDDLVIDYLLLTGMQRTFPCKS